MVSVRLCPLIPKSAAVGHEQLTVSTVPDVHRAGTFAKLVGHGASIAGILPQLGILGTYTVILLALASAIGDLRPGIGGRSALTFPGAAQVT